MKTLLAVMVTALVVALGATAAANVLPLNSVTSAQVKNGSLLAADFKPGQLPKAAPAGAGAAGERGPKGDDGARGAPGPAGPRGQDGQDGADGKDGAAGPEAIPGYRITSHGEFVNAAGAEISVNQGCPPGTVVLGGGVSSNAKLVVHESYPSSPTTWTIRVTFPNQTVVYPYAICATGAAG